MKATKSVLLSCIAALSIVANGAGASASASTFDLTNNTGVNPNQTAIILEDRLEEIKNDNRMSEEDKQRHIEKVEYFIELRDSSNLTRATYTPPRYSKTLSVPYCMQVKNNYCGPATVQQTCKYYGKANVDTQSSIAEAIGTTSSGTDVQPILNYVNGMLGTTYEQFWLSANATNYEGSKRLICESIENNCPPIMWVSVSSEYGGNRDLGINGDTLKWPYTVGGHYLNASGYSQNGKVYQMTDPWIGKGVYETNPNGGKFWVDDHTTYMVTNVVSA